MTRLTTLAVGAALALPLAACSAPDRTPGIPTTTSATARGSTSSGGSTSTAPANCTPSNALASYKPVGSQPKPGAMPSGTLMADIQTRGYLLVGTSSDTLLLSARNSSNVYAGFDIEMAKAVATAIFGDASPQHLRFRAISAGDRVKLVNNGASNGGVDMIARAMTVNCQRWGQVAFSGVYLASTQQVLVRRTASEKTLAALGKAGKTVCATNGSTTLEALKKVRGVRPVGVTYTTDCMALWQQGQVDAISADDAILAGLRAQDPAAEVPGQEHIENEPYGLAVAKNHPEFAQFINGVLENLRKGGWEAAYEASGLQTYLPNRTQPEANYTRPLPNS